MSDDGYIVGEQFEREWNRIRDTVDARTEKQPNGDGSDGKQHPQVVLLNVTGAISGGAGRYTAKAIVGTTNNDPGNLTIDDLGKVGTKALEFWNIDEIGSSEDTSGTPVQGILKGFNSTTGNPIYIGSMGGRVRVKVGSSLGEGGKYAGVFVTGTATNAALSGITATSTSVIIVNEPEEGSTVSTPMIETTPICSGDIVGTDEETGYPIVLISCFTGYQCGT
jgi:hypothetical protein